MENIIISIPHDFYGGMAELVDALDSKSCSLWECQFKSDYPYQVKKNALYCRAFFIFRYIQNNPQALPKLELIDYSFFNPNLFCLRTRDENSAISQK